MVRCSPDKLRSKLYLSHHDNPIRQERAASGWQAARLACTVPSVTSARSRRHNRRGEGALSTAARQKMARDRENSGTHTDLPRPGGREDELSPDLRSPGPGLLHRQLGLEAVEIAIDRSNGEHAAVAAIAQQAVLRLDVALDRDRVPALGMTDIIDRHVIVLAPEERHRVEALFVPEHVGCRGL